MWWRDGDQVQTSGETNAYRGMSNISNEESSGKQGDFGTGGSSLKDRNDQICPLVVLLLETNSKR